jgi:SAM-dependent methyltransferase
VVTSEYTGADVLEFMTAAKNYNAFLLREVVRHAEGATQAVDFGAGIGTFAKMVRDAGLDVVCVEPDERQLVGLRQDGFTAFPDLSVVPSASVPYLYTLNVLEHIENDAEALRAIFHALRPGGRCLIYVPAFPILYSSFDQRLGHFRRYRRRSLAALVRSQGFAIEEATYKDSIGFAAALVFRLVAKPDGSVSEAAISIFDRFLFPLSAQLDRIMGRICGKNVMICARKPFA